MFKKILLLFCLALSFITFSCSKDKEPDKTPHIPALSQTMWEGVEEEYNGNSFAFSCRATLIFANEDSMNYVTYESGTQYNNSYKYSAGDRVIRIGNLDYYALEASQNQMVLQTYTHDYKRILRLTRK